MDTQPKVGISIPGKLIDFDDINCTCCSWLKKTPKTNTKETPK